MTTMGKVDTSDLIIITWAMNKSFQSPELKWVSWTHTTPYILMTEVIERTSRMLDTLPQDKQAFTSFQPLWALLHNDNNGRQYVLFVLYFFKGRERFFAYGMISCLVRQPVRSMMQLPGKSKTTTIKPMDYVTVRDFHVQVLSYSIDGHWRRARRSQYFAVMFHGITKT